MAYIWRFGWANVWGRLQWKWYMISCFSVFCNMYLLNLRKIRDNWNRAVRLRLPDIGSVRPRLRLPLRLPPHHCWSKSQIWTGCILNYLIPARDHWRNRATSLVLPYLWFSRATVHQSGLTCMLGTARCSRCTFLILPNQRLLWGDVTAWGCVINERKCDVQLCSTNQNCHRQKPYSIAWLNFRICVT